MQGKSSERLKMQEKVAACLAAKQRSGTKRKKRKNLHAKLPSELTGDLAAYTYMISWGERLSGGKAEETGNFRQGRRGETRVPTLNTDFGIQTRERRFLAQR